MTQDELQVLLTWFSVVVGVIGIVSFIFNIYQHFKIQSLRQAVDSIDRIAKPTLFGGDTNARSYRWLLFYRKEHEVFG